MAIIIGLVFGMLFAAVYSGAVLYIVSKFNLGIKVKDFLSAMVVGVVIGLISAVFSSVLSNFFDYTPRGFMLALFQTLITAAAIMATGKFFPDQLEVEGYKGAVVAAVTMGVIGFIVNAIIL